MAPFGRSMSCDLCVIPVYFRPGHWKSIGGLAPEAAGSPDEGREHRAHRVSGPQLRLHQLPGLQVNQGLPRLIVIHEHNVSDLNRLNSNWGNLCECSDPVVTG